MLLPVAKKNLDLYFFETNSINSINFFAGTRLVGPDPPIPKRIFFSFGFILNFFLVSGWGFEKGPSFNGPVWSVSVEIIIYFFFFYLG